MQLQGSQALRTCHGGLTETTSAMQRLRLPLSSLMVMGLSSLILSMASGQSS